MYISVDWLYRNPNHSHVKINHTNEIHVCMWWIVYFCVNILEHLFMIRIIKCKIIFPKHSLRTLMDFWYLGWALLFKYSKNVLVLWKFLGPWSNQNKFNNINVNNLCKYAFSLLSALWFLGGKQSISYDCNKWCKLVIPHFVTVLI